MAFVLPPWASVSLSFGDDLGCARKKTQPLRFWPLEEKDPFGDGRPQSVNPQLPEFHDELQVLSVDRYSESIVSSVQDHSVVLANGETGSGKSTRIPQMVLDDHISRSVPCRIAVAEQRRLSAIRLAERVASERGEYLCKDRTASVGYAVRHNFMLPRSLYSLTFLTEKILLNRLAHGSFSHVFLDEVHEHTLDTDLLLKILRDMIRTGAPLKVVLMSATVGVGDKFSEYFTGSSFREIYVPGRTHDVSRYFADEEDQAMTHWKKPADVIVEAVAWCLCNEEEGDMLVFLSGFEEIRDCSKALQATEGITVCQLHSHATSGPVFDSVDDRKVILSTNIAESSITVDGVVFVIDFFREKIRVRTGLETQQIAMASAIQRAGRSGRTRPGKCLCMVSRQVFEQLSSEKIPQIQRASLCSAIMYILQMGFVDNTYGPELKSFLEAMIHTPRLMDLKEDVAKLETLGLTVQGHLTSLGEVVSNLPFTEEVSVALCAGAMLGVGQHVALALAGTINAKFRQCLFKQRRLVDFVTSYGAEETHSELFASATFLEACAQNSSLWEGSLEVLSDIFACYDEMCTAVKEMGALKDSSGRWFEEQWSLIDFALICGFRKQVAMASSSRWTYIDADEVIHHVNQKSVIQDPRTSGVYFVESFNTQLYGVSPCRPLGLLAFGGSHIEGQPNDHVCLDKFVDLCFHWESEPKVLNLRLAFDHLLNRFCEGTASAEKVQDMVTLLSANTGMASSTLWRKRMASAVKVTVGPRDDNISAVVQVKPNTDTRPVVVVPSSLFDDLPPLQSLPVCRKNEKHLPTSKKRKHSTEYGLFTAAHDGCLRCVRRELEKDQNVNPYQTSEWHGYTVKDFAKDAEKQGTIGARAVVEYLEKYWPGIP